MPRLVPVVMTRAMEAQAAGRGPQRSGLPERSSSCRVLSADQEAGMVETSPSEPRTREERVVRLDQEEGRGPPREGSLRGERGQTVSVG